ncbi:MAG: MSHA biogenesis protein MshQ, partial [Candidatus Moranbacteria bacterium GW2011_GWF2_35_54]
MIKNIKKILTLEFWESVAIAILRPVAMLIFQPKKTGKRMLAFLKQLPQKLFKTRVQDLGSKSPNSKGLLEPKTKRKLIFSLVLILLVITPLSFYFWNREAGASWWNSDWFYRKSIAVTNNTTTENNVYITLALDTSDTAKFQTDCGDIRFVKSGGQILPYYIVSGCGSTSTIIHTNFDVFDAGTQNIDFYYGNPYVDNGFSTTDFATQASNYTIGTISQEEKGPSPSLYLPLDEGFGSTAHDESSNRNDGAIVGATWKDESMCKSGKCLEFDGTGDYVEINDNSSLDLTNDVTLEAWIKPQSTTPSNQTIISKIETPSGPTKIFRSVGPSATTAITVGTSNAMNITGDRATFATALPDNVGVGDVIQYDDDDDSDIDANDSIVFITERITNYEYRIMTASGGVPTPINADLNWSLFRAYISLSNAEKGVENTGIDSDLRNFDDWTAGGDATTDDVGKDLVAANQQWNIACYANGTTADTVATAINDWTAGIKNYINIFTPFNSNEVGVSQRHAGKWDSNKYKISIAEGILINIDESYVRVDGLQFMGNGTGGYNHIGVNTDLTTGDMTGNIVVSNNIFQGLRHGISSYRMTPGINYYLNNIIYKGEAGYGGINLYVESYIGKFWVYNNTIYGCGIGIDQTSNEIVYAKNNIVQGATTGYNGTFDAASSNNISSDATAPGANSKNSTTVSFVSTTAGSEDFHLAPTDTAAKDSGADLSGDSVFPIATDVDGQARSTTNPPSPLSKGGVDGLWDIGADEAQATQIYRSVAPNKTDALETGAENALTIVGNVVTFQRALPDNAGVGDVIQYDDDGDGDIDASDSLAFITGRISNFEYTVSSSQGGLPVAVSSDQDWSLFRAYTSLANAESGTENTGIDSDLRNFDTWSGGKDLVASKEQWNIACYANGTTADTTAVDVDGWNTGVQNFVKVYTPVYTNEVGVSQRHEGSWDDGKYKLIALNPLGVYENYTRMIGIQVGVDTTATWSGQAILSSFGSNYYQLYDSLIIRKYAGSNTAYNAITLSDFPKGTVIRNSVIYGFNAGTYGAINVSTDNSTDYLTIQNTTIYNSVKGIRRGTGAYTKLVNVLSYGNSTSDFDVNGGSWNASSSNNISSDGTAPGTNSKISQTVQFVDTANGDLHLSPTDTAARNAGADLSADANLPVITDIDGEERKTFDIGADEAVATKIYRSVGPGNTTALATDESHENIISVSSGLATFNVALPNRIGVGDAVLVDTNADNAITSADTLLFIHGRNSATSYELRTHTGVIPTNITSNDTYQIFRAYTSLSLAEAGTKNTSIPITFNGGNRDLVTNNEEWNLACYGDSVDTTGVSVFGWTTGLENLIKIYTPVDSDEVGVRQRHKGTSQMGYMISVATGNILYVTIPNVVIDGIDIQGGGSNHGIYEEGTAGAGVLKVSNSLIHNIGRGIVVLGETDTYIYNNIIYDKDNNMGIQNANANNHNFYIYNNVVYGNGTSYGIVGRTNTIAKNNISVGNPLGDYYNYNSWTSASVGNISQDATSPNTDLRNKTVTFRDATNKDFRLAMTDTAAKGAGLNLSYDVNNPVRDDVEGELRPSLRDLSTPLRSAQDDKSEAFDIGADQISSTIHNNYSLNLKTNYPQTNFSTADSDTENFSSGDINLPANTWSHIVYKRNNNVEEFYINGSKKDSSSISNFLKTNNGKLYIGAKNNLSQDSFKGFIDEIKIYPYARTENEVKKDTTAGSSGRAASRAAEGVSVSMGDKAQTLSDGLVGYWKMDESTWNGTAGEVEDASGNNNHGIAVGGASTTVGKFGSGGGFDGVDDWVSTNVTLPAYPIFTYSSWVKISSAPASTYVIIGPKDGADPDFKIYSDRRLLLQSSGIGTVGWSTGVVPLNEWTHVAVFCDASNKKYTFYINGQLSGSGTYAGDYFITTSKLEIGSRYLGASSFFNGNIDETRIYNRALSPDEIKQLYNYAPGPVMHLKMDEKVSGD